MLKKILAFILLAALFTLGLWLGYGLFFPGPWTLDQLRALDPADAADPAADITAIYIRRAGLDCQVRLDLLDLPSEPGYYLEISLGERKTTLSSLTPPPPDASASLDPLADTITVTLKNCFPPANAPLAVLSLPSPVVGYAPDEAGPVAFDAPPPQARATLRFAFTNTFAPAATPLQALRRWDGAHTGANGERHGLRNLLDAAEKYQIPLTLLDLKTPAALSAIETLDGLGQVRRMERDNLLQMPSVISGEPADVSLALGRSAAQGFGLRSGPGIYDSLSPQPLWPLNEPINPQDGGLPPNGDASLEFRRALIDSALRGGETFTLGGDFAQSGWGTPDYVIPAFAYLAARPYIQVITLPLASAATPAASGEPAALRNAPRNKITDSAWQAYFQGTSATDDEQLMALRQNYHVVEDLLLAAWWAENPQAMSACDETTGRCLLASIDFLAILDALGGRVTYLFAGETQVIGPTAQFFIGFSDRMEWDLSKGEAADPAQVMGAFVDADMPFRSYTPVVLDETSIRFTSAGGGVKTYRLTENGLEAQVSGPVEMKIPLVVAPQGCFKSGWASGYVMKVEAGRIGWGVKPGPMAWIQVRGGAVLARDSFLDGMRLGASPEDPNAEIPAGMLLPFPLAMIRVSGAAGEVVTITVER